MKKQERAKEREGKRKKPFFTTVNLVVSIVCLLVFLVAGVGAYYLMTGSFVSQSLAVVYAVLALAGALAVLFRRNRFAILYYVGCVMGWGVGQAISRLNGAFAPTAGVIVTFFFIGVFVLFGIIAEAKGIKRRRLKKREAKQAEEERAAVAAAPVEAALPEENPAEAPVLAASAAVEKSPAPIDDEFDDFD